MNPNFSPADSLLSAPSEAYSSLFDGEGASPAVSALTPQSLHDSSDREDSRPPNDQATDSDRKNVKKRKSWGQELPTPKTNLPPRKRAKTEDEKEQRRIERVLRNRAAAQSSRERKRKEVEGLEEEKQDIVRQNQLLTGRLQEVEIENSKLSETIAKMAAEMSVFRTMLNGDLPTAQPLKTKASPTLTADLYPASALDGAVPQLKMEQEDVDFVLPAPQNTMDPRDADFTTPSGSPQVGPTNATTPNLTQHPAEMLCDLQCQLGVNRPEWGSAWTMRQQPVSPALMTMLPHLLLATMLSTASSLLLHPLARIFHSLKTGSPLLTAGSPDPMVFPLIRWLISTPTNPLTTSTSTTRSRHHPSSTFRTSLLRRLLACSPALARPLRDATGQALQLKSSRSELATAGRVAEVSGDGLTGRGGQGDEGVGVAGGGGDELASLMTLLWGIETTQRALAKEREEKLTVRAAKMSQPSAVVTRLYRTEESKGDKMGGEVMAVD
ncbi:MAG: hypothetical protein M1825_002995 [Sarcosagium campestre]|nr:MAG: hypothetical protein M1825_002995 [Sarcosagium campestre]